MSAGASVAPSPVAARIASSRASRAPCVRASAMMWAPALARAMAAASPIPRDAPVTTAMRPASGRSDGISGKGSSLAGIDEQADAGRRRAVFKIGEAGGVVAGEAGVAEARELRITARLADGP